VVATKPIRPADNRDPRLGSAAANTSPASANPHSTCALAATLSRGFFPWRLSDAGPNGCRAGI
jgi:hypothetical protein